ncbi:MULTISPECIES: hypothetical protein [Sphingobacterium]|uniref:ABC transporter permease n=1 Tax=Sphingobacterium populi TaxID=1812824 RepID=A0ABW5UDR6_9SPHI|nr:hypothetical protein [Sphingobacterium sp. CFCC 11742]
MGSWLMQFTYHTDLHWWIFAAVGFGVVAISLFTVSSQAIRAALANPTNSLREE